LEDPGEVAGLVVVFAAFGGSWRKVKMTGRFDWRKHLAVHPAADLFPLMSEAELKELADDIKKNGLIDPLVVWKKGGSLLDGRNRLDAMALAGILGVDSQGRLCNASSIVPIIWHRIGTGDPWSIALSLNVHRRHLSLEQKRDLIAKVLKATPEKSDRQIAKIVKRDHKTVAAVRSEEEGRGEIPHVDAHTDTKGRKQPAAKPKRAAAKPKPQPEPETQPTRSQQAAQPQQSPKESAAERRAYYASTDPEHDFPEDLSVEMFKTKLDDFLSDFESTLAMWLDEHPVLESNGRDVLIEVLEDHAHKLSALGLRIAGASAVLQ
jgi:hypothetical protein